MTGSRKPADMRARRGLCDPNERIIWIDSRVPRDEQERTLIHEIVHAALDGKRWPEDPAEAEEVVAYALEDPIRLLLLSGALAVVPEEAR